jgi:hypothetical protein
VRRQFAVVALVGTALSACTSAQQDEAVEAADVFVRAVEENDGEAACAVLAPATVSELVQSSKEPCEQAVLEEARRAGSRLSTNTYGTMAQVRYREDVLFVTRFESGWKVLAAACTEKSGDPYDCQIAGR